MYKYKAFISYSHRDASWGDWLHKGLERYRVPKSLVGQPSRSGEVPSRLFPIFRDREELPTSSHMPSMIQEALEQSAYLIVMCSPEAAKSHWVNEEILVYKRMGREDRILAIIVDGEPNATDRGEPDNEAFPPALRFAIGEDGQLTDERAEPIAADAREQGDGKEDAKLKLIAGLLGVNFADLKQRDLKYRQSIQRRIAASIAAAIIIIASLSTWVWDQNYRIKTRYYADVVERYGLPEGINPYSGRNAPPVYSSWRIRTRGDQVLDLTRVNGHGFPRDRVLMEYLVEPWDKGVARWIYGAQDERGFSVEMFSSTMRRIRSAEYQISEDQSQIVVRFDSSFGNAERQRSTATILVAEDPTSVLYGSPPSYHTNIGQYRLLLNDQGFAPQRLFEPIGGGENVGDSQGAYGRAYRFGPAGQIEAIWNTDAAGQILEGQNGFATVGIERNESGRVTTISWSNATGSEVLNAHGFASLILAYDDHGNIIEERYFDLAAELVERKDMGVASIAMVYDENGNVVEEHYFGLDGEPVVRWGFWLASFVWVYDDRGNVVEQRHLGVDGGPVMAMSPSSSSQTYAYDERGNTIEWRFFDLDSEPFLLPYDGYARVSAAYDDLGNIIGYSWFGLDGEPVLHATHGAAGIAFNYDDQGNMTAESFFGIEGEPVLHSNHGAAQIAHTYDDRGNVVDQRYLGIDGEPVFRSEQVYARVAIEYDDQGNIIEKSYFGIDSDLVLLPNSGYARVSYAFDVRGNQTDIQFYGVDGESVLHLSEGYAREIRLFDERDNLLEIGHFGVDGEPILSRNHDYARAVIIYDNLGNRIETHNFGVDGELLSIDEYVDRSAFPDLRISEDAARRLNGLHERDAN